MPVTKAEFNKSINPKIDELLIQNINERIQQEFNNLSADELKANVLAATSVIFAILAVSTNLKIFSLDANFTFLYLFYFIFLVLLLTSFILGIYVIKPKKDRWKLWDPENSVKEYNVVAKLDEAQRLLRNELIDTFNDIQSAREKDGGHLRTGYWLLIFGSLGMLITLILFNYYLTLNG